MKLTIDDLKEQGWTVAFNPEGIYPYQWEWNSPSGRVFWGKSCRKIPQTILDEFQKLQKDALPTSGETVNVLPFPFIVSLPDGSPPPKGAIFVVLRLDNGGEREYVTASRFATLAFCVSCESYSNLRKIGKVLKQMTLRLLYPSNKKE